MISKTYEEAISNVAACAATACVLAMVIHVVTKEKRKDND